MPVIRLNANDKTITLRKSTNAITLKQVGRRGIQGPQGDPGDPGVVQSVNGKSVANVVLDHTDVGADPAGSASQALSDAKDYTDSEVSTLDSSLATVAKTGSYDDLSDKPTIPSIAGLATEAQVQDVQDNLDAHEADTANPHSVTKAQVGLGNVDNTSDANKPVSTAQQTALDGKAKKIFINSPLPFAPTTDVVATNRLVIIGLDEPNNRLFARDGSLGFISQSDDWGATWTHSKARPTGIRYNNMVKMVAYNGYFYLTADDTAGVWHIFRCPAVSAGTAYSWEETATYTYRTDANNAVRTAFTATTSSLFAGEYCNVASLAGGPSIYRSTDGISWSNVYTDYSARHIHAIAEDPYNIGTIYASIGDNGTSNSIVRSTDGGLNWTTVITSAQNLWQSVQISFSENWVWLAMDRIGGTVAVFDRDDLIPLIAASNLPHNMAVPGAAASTDRFYMIGYFGKVDPEMESFYLAVQDTSSAGNKFGLFWLPHVGGKLELLDIYPTGSGLTEVFIANNTLWAGSRKRPLITIE